MNDREVLLEVRSGGYRLLWVITLLPLAVGLGFFLFVGGGSGIGLIMLGGLIAYSRAPELRPVRLTRGGLIVPQHARDQYIPIESIAGVGLSWVGSARSASWRTSVWDTDGLALNVRKWHSRVEEITNSVGAQQTKALWEAVLEVQGPDGPLATLALQHHAFSSWAERIWCPDDDAVYQPVETG